MASRGSLDGVVSHWCTLIENLQASPLEFYASVEAALQRRQVPATKGDRIDYKESGALSANREYLHVMREKLTFDICGAPFGTGFFVSWWLTEAHARLSPAVAILILILELGIVLWTLTTVGLLWGAVTVLAVLFGLFWTVQSFAKDGGMNDDFIRVLPLLGPVYSWLFKRETFYRIDTMLMFQKAVHNAVMEVIDEMTTAKGLRALGENERKPVMREFYQRKAA